MVQNQQQCEGRGVKTFVNKKWLVSRTVMIFYVERTQKLLPLKWFLWDFAARVQYLIYFWEKKIFPTEIIISGNWWKSFFHGILTPWCRSSSLHAKWASWVYQSENKYKHFENQFMNSFMDVSIVKKKMKNMNNIVF